MENNAIQSAVTLVTIPKFLSVILRPQIGEYESPYILSTIPCEKKDGKYFELRTGKEVKKTPDMLEWNNLTGTFFRYPDGYELLITRRFCDNKIVVMEPERFDKNSMLLRQVINRSEKKSH